MLADTLFASAGVPLASGRGETIRAEGLRLPAKHETAGPEGIKPPAFFVFPCDVQAQHGLALSWLLIDFPTDTPSNLRYITCIFPYSPASPGESKLTHRLSDRYRGDASSDHPSHIGET